MSKRKTVRLEVREISPESFKMQVTAVQPETTNLAGDNKSTDYKLQPTLIHRYVFCWRSSHYLLDHACTHATLSQSANTLTARRSRRQRRPWTWVTSSSSMSGSREVGHRCRRQDALKCASSTNDVTLSRKLSPYGQMLSCCRIKSFSRIRSKESLSVQRTLVQYQHTRREIITINILW